MQQNTSDFAELGAAPMPRGRREFLSDGTYLAEVIAVKKVRSTKPHQLGEIMFIIELAIVEVLQQVDTTTPGEKVAVTSNLPGDLCAHIIKLQWSKAFSTIKGFLGAAMQLGASEALELDTKAGAWPEIADRAVFREGDEQPPGFEGDPWVPQPLKGATVKVRAKTIAQTRNPDKDFTVIEYFGANSESDPAASV